MSTSIFPGINNSIVIFVFTFYVCRYHLCVCVRVCAWVLLLLSGYVCTYGCIYCVIVCNLPLDETWIFRINVYWKVCAQTIHLQYIIRRFLIATNGNCNKRIEWIRQRQQQKKKLQNKREKKKKISESLTHTDFMRCLSHSWVDIFTPPTEKNAELIQEHTFHCI